jgi:DNA-directed RNA polymerase specialized sigma24 family protein
VRAEAEFERLRRTLLRFFDWRGASAPDDLADETLDRLARKLQEGTAVADLGAFAHGIARLVLHESVRGDARHRGLDGVEPHAPAPRESGEAELLAVRLERCLAALPRDSRELLLAYYSGGEGGRKIETRRRLARQWRLTQNALRSRVQRVRDRVESCVRSGARHVSPGQDTHE